MIICLKLTKVRSCNDIISIFGLVTLFFFSLSKMKCHDRFTLLDVVGSFTLECGYFYIRMVSCF